MTGSTAAAIANNAAQQKQQGPIAKTVPEKVFIKRNAVTSKPYSG